MERTFKVIEWPTTGAHKWLVEVTGKDGSYTPVIELYPQGNGTAPTPENQLYQAAQLLAESGPDAVDNPHAMIGRACGCGECFCCAAVRVLAAIDWGGDVTDYAGEEIDDE